jgi:FkbM family methyltransferase
MDKINKYKDMMSKLNKNYYSQHGEDSLLLNIFKNKTEGFFVEVGCVDGKRFSNTLYLENIGWNGLCIEPQKEYINYLKINRPDSKIIHCAVGSENKKKIEFYADKRGSLSSLDKSREQNLKRDYKTFTGYTRQDVEMKTLNKIFEQNNVKNIDVISIDIEGAEIQALEGLDIPKYNPKVFILEFSSITQFIKLLYVMVTEGYHLGFIVGTNLFFFSDKKMAKEIRGMMYTVTLVRTANPFFEEKDKAEKVTVDTNLKPQFTTLLKMSLMPLVHKIRYIFKVYD